MKTPVCESVQICSSKLCVSLNSTICTGAYVRSSASIASSLMIRRLARLRWNVINCTKPHMSAPMRHRTIRRRAIRRLARLRWNVINCTKPQCESKVGTHAPLTVRRGWDSVPVGHPPEWQALAPDCCMAARMREAHGRRPRQLRQLEAVVVIDAMSVCK